jgi:hypothetical protein
MAPRAADAPYNFCGLLMGRPLLLLAVAGLESGLNCTRMPPAAAALARGEATALRARLL